MSLYSRYESRYLDDLCNRWRYSWDPDRFSLGDMKIGIVGAIVIGILGSNIGGRVFTKFDLNIFTGWEDAIMKPFIGAIGFLVVIGFLHRD